MSDYRIGDKAAFGGRMHHIRGVSPMGVRPQRLYLEDVDSGESIEVTADELAVDAPAVDAPRFGAGLHPRAWAREAFATTATALLPAETRRRIAVRMPWLPVAGENHRRAGATKDAAYFERRFATAVAADPWGYEANPVELAKYGRTLEVCGLRGTESVLELACAAGVFTEMLAPRCRSLLAVDISEVAVRAARARVARFGNVRCERRTLPEDPPSGSFELILCSDFLTFLNEKDIEAVARVMAALSSESGAIVVVNHHRRITTDPSRMFEIVERQLESFTVTHDEQLERHRIVRFDRDRAVLARAATATTVPAREGTAEVAQASTASSAAVLPDAGSA